MMLLQTLAALSAFIPLALAATDASIVSTTDSISTTDQATINTFVKKCGGTGSVCGCSVLTSVFGSSQVFAPGSATYQKEAAYYWDSREIVAPKCVFVPTSTASLAKAMAVFTGSKSPFAVRGGGHMPVVGAASIGASGVLIAMTNFNAVTVNTAKQTVDTGSGVGWISVYSALDKYGLYCIGGRLKSIGVAGLTLGGGINYLAAKHGLAMDGVTAYEVVLASGKVVTATATTNSDLFWGLKGGNNNFGIVTKFTLKTFPLTSIGGGLIGYSAAQTSAYIDAVAAQALYQENYQLDAGTIPTLSFNPNTGVEDGMLFTFAAGKTATPPVFANYTAIPQTYAQLSVSTPAVWHNQFDTPYNIQRVIFGVHSVAPDAANLKHMWKTMMTYSLEFKANTGLHISISLQPITKSTTAVAKNNGIGNAMGTDSSKPYIWWALNVFWTNATDDAAVLAWSKKVVEAVHASNVKKGLASNEIYTGDAADWQDPIASYPAANIAKLKTIRSKYDPNLVFKNLVPGGFKIPA